MRNASELAQLARQARAGRVARDLAHEINSLLMGVVGVADVPPRATPGELRAALDTAGQYGRQLADLVRSFQNLYVNTSDEGVSADPADVLAQSLALCSKEMVRNKIEVRKRCGHLPRVRAGVGPLQQVVVELLLRAVDAMAGGGELEVLAEGSGEFVTITAAAHPREPREEADETPAPGPHLAWARDAAGDGLAGAPDGHVGLAAAQWTARQWGGELSVERAAPHAVRFIARVPVCRGSIGP